MAIDRLIFLDGFGTATNVTRTHALAEIGARAVCRVPHGHWKTISTIAAMGARGMVAATSFDWAADTEAFLMFLRDQLVPQLHTRQVVVLDNLPAHKSPRVDRLVKAAGCSVLRLPPYAPDFNPIEMAISKTKRLLRSRAERTTSGLFDGMGKVPHQLTPEGAVAFITHCGNAATAE